MNTALKLYKVFEQPSKTEFELITEHLAVHHVSQNMHLRDTRQLNKKRTLRFFHMVKLIKPNVVAGHISGPENLELDYEITFTAGKCQYTIKHYDGAEKALVRISKSLKKWLLKRVSSEKENRDDPKVKYTKGQFYLRRSKDGMAIAHANIQAGLKSGAFNLNFAKKVEPWGFEVLHP